MGQWPKAAYIWHPEGVVFHGHGHHTAGRLLVIDAGVSHRFKGCEDDVHPLSRPEVSSKRLWVEAGEGRDATLSILGRAGRAALQRDAGQQSLSESWQHQLLPLRGAGWQERALGDGLQVGAWAFGKKALRTARRAGSAALALPLLTNVSC